MKKTITLQDFQEEFKDYGRANQFKHGLTGLYEYLTDMESDGNEIELDVISLCCSFTESKLSEALKEYDMDSLEELQENTTVIVINENLDDDTSDPIVIYENF